MKITLIEGSSLYMQMGDADYSRMMTFIVVLCSGIQCGSREKLVPGSIMYRKK